jgi:hypothetical protein
MTLLTFALFLVTPCLFLPGVILAFVYGVRHSSTDDDRSPVLQTTLKERSADVRQLDIDAREQAWNRENWEGPENYVADRLTEASQDVRVRARYAEASVPVNLKEGGREWRRCSLCLN